MFSAPDDATAQRMRTARAFACATLMLAARVRQTLGHVLDTPAARVAELTICAQILQAADRTPFYKELVGPVKEYLGTTYERTA
ncbi:hypothetical protein [Streptomyces broussonetiae]|uniref:Uncharacterized protein n=1 Tax=Streptomyces broussonetiae TaxID=2686304 RepID=A0A6I6N4D6_9ACTN|nr:hypothetical protein [Streptomyces broussonetiae]QHA05271.1 hypothetical protein GQF42_20010 [Streptomyces broussonetiae]